RDGDAAHLRGPRASGAAALLDHLGVALDQVDPVEGDAELLREHLREGRLVSLAVAEGADDELRTPLLRQDHARPFLRLAAGGLDEIADADAAQRAARLCGGAAGGEALP